MKTKKLVSRSFIEPVVDSETCDFCGSSMETHARHGYHHSSVTIKATTGDVFPDVDLTTTAEFDCCVACWKSKLRPALEALGGRCYEYETGGGRIESMPLVGEDLP